MVPTYQYFIYFTGHGLDGALKDLDTRLRNCETGRTKENAAITAKIKDVEKKVDTSDVNNRMKTLQVIFTLFSLFSYCSL